MQPKIVADYSAPVKAHERFIPVSCKKHPSGALIYDFGQNFAGVALYSDLEQTGSFACSNEMLNQLQSNIVWGAKSNLVDIPTDCPQRDERMGWTGDMAVDWWDDACVPVPWAEYRARGDEEILRKYYPVMKKYVKTCLFGRGCCPRGKTNTSGTPRPCSTSATGWPRMYLR